jgi:hypothetical protein
MEETICSAISDKEIKGRINKLKKTAPGPDGVEWKHLQGPAVSEALRYMFNTLLISGLQPTEWKTNRTTLIPKAGKDPLKAENNRPITIGSLIGSLLGYN